MLQESVPASSVVSRTGGDEFTVMTALERDSQLPGAVEKKLRKAMEDLNENSGLPYIVEASYGWEFRPASDIASLDDCVNRADNKMYDMKFRKRTANRFAGRARNEIDRRFGSAKQRVFILSADDAVRKEIAGLFDLGYLLSPLETVEEAVRQLEACDDAVILFVDNQLPEQTGIQFMRELPESLRRNVVSILLLEREEDDAIADAFAIGMEDVLIKPFNTVLNRCRTKLLSQMNITNQKLHQILEQHVNL